MSKIVEFVRVNEVFCIVFTLAFALVTLVLGCEALSVRRCRVMAEHGYVQVQKAGTTDTFWSKPNR